LRIEAPGLTYHVTSRGNGRKAIYLDDGDRLQFLELLAVLVHERQIVCHAFCEMTNHYHLVVTTLLANLSAAMRQLNGDYASWWNRRHRQVGHMYQGRFDARVVQDECYLLTACAYAVLNPVRAGIVSAPEDWPWSSYRATAGIDEVPPFLSPQAVWRYAGIQDGRGYCEYVASAGATKLPDQPILGDEEFVKRFARWRETASREVPLRERDVRPSLEEIFQRAGARVDRDRGILCARAHGYPMKAIAHHLNLDRNIVRRIVRRNPPLPPKHGAPPADGASKIETDLTPGGGQT
jgi:REP element-mobilizing transposase RayT